MKRVGYMEPGKLVISQFCMSGSKRAMPTRRGQPVPLLLDAGGFPCRRRRRRSRRTPCHHPATLNKQIGVEVNLRLAAHSRRAQTPDRAYIPRAMPHDTQHTQHLISKNVGAPFCGRASPWRLRGTRTSTTTAAPPAAHQSTQRQA